MKAIKVVAAAACLAGGISAIAQDKKMSVQETSFGSANIQWETSAISPDGTRLAYVVQDKFQKNKLMLDGKVALDKYDNFGKEGLYFSPDSSRFVAVVSRNSGIWNVVDNGMESPDYNAIGSALTLSDDSKRLFYVGIRNNQQIVFCNGKEYPAQGIVHNPIITPDGVIFSTLLNNQVFTYVNGENIGLRKRIFASVNKTRFAIMDVKPSNKFTLTVDGKESPESTETIPSHFSNDGAHYAYICKSGVKSTLYVDGKPIKSADTIRWIRFSPDGSACIFDSTDNGKYEWSIGEESFSGNRLVDAAFSQDGKRLACVFSETVDGKQRKRLILDAEKREDMEDFVAKSLQFSPDGEHLAYMQAQNANNQRQVRVAKDGEFGPWFADCQQLMFSPDGSHFVYIGVEKEAKRLVLDNKPLAYNYPDIVPASLAFSQDGNLLAYIVGKEGKQKVVCNDIPGPNFNTIHDNKIFFSSDGAHYAYIGIKNNAQNLVIDGVLSPDYDKIHTPKLNKMGFDKENAFTIIAEKNKLLNRVKCSVK